MARAHHASGVSLRAMAASILVLGSIASLVVNWPGQLSYDSVVQLHDGRVGHYNPWHPPVMSWMLGVADRLLPGTGLFILFDVSLATACLVSLLWILPRTSRASVFAAALVVALPQSFLYQGIVWKDVLFADCALAGFVMLAHAAENWRSPAARWPFLCFAFLFLVLAALARQNGAITIPLGALALLLIARREGGRWSTAIALFIGAAAMSFALVFAVSGKLAERTGGTTGVAGQWKLLQLYDLIGEVKRSPSLRLSGLTLTNSNLAQLIRTDGVRLYTPARNDTLVGSVNLQHEFVSTSPAAVAAQWNDNLLVNPGTYMAVRAQVFYWLLFTPDPVRCDAVYTGLDGPPKYLRELGLTKRFRVQDRALAAYAGFFVDTPVFSHVAYALLAVIILGFLFRRGRAADIAMASLLACALTFALSFFVIAIACDYRYLLFLDLGSVGAGFYCVATWPAAKKDTA